MANWKHGSSALVHYFAASRVLSQAEVLFLHSCFSRTSAGTFRILVNVNMCPAGSRPICNLRYCWFQPFSIFLVEKLAPLISDLSSVAVSTNQLLQQLESITCLPQMSSFTLDVVNSYPSVNRNHMLALVASFRKQRLSNPGLCDFIIRILELVLDACIVSFDGCLYHSQGGIPTGFSVASILANPPTPLCGSSAGEALCSISWDI